MSYNIEDLEKIAKKLRYDLTAMQGKVSDLLNAISDVARMVPESTDGFRCRSCGLPFNTVGLLIDHRRNVHWEDIPISDEEAA